MNFWKDLPKSFFALAPMEDVTDTVFRELVAANSSPGMLHVLFTEFMSVDGFLHEVGHEKVRHRLVVSKEERKVLAEKGIKIVAQIWGSDPEKFFRAGKLLTEQYSFDGIDINMGCPVKKIVKNNGCSALINTPDIAKEIVLATREGSGMPVSVKTRIGFNDVITEKWISSLLDVRPEAITIHGRTQKMQSEGMADWNEVQKSVLIRDSLSPDTIILGNGDVASYEDGLQKSLNYGAEGIMVGRGIFSNPAFFSGKGSLDTGSRIELLKNHLVRFEQEWEGQKNFAILKRFFKIYIHSFDGATETRSRLMNTGTCREALEILDTINYESINSLLATDEFLMQPKLS